MRNTGPSTLLTAWPTSIEMSLKAITGVPANAAVSAGSVLLPAKSQSTDRSDETDGKAAPTLTERSNWRSTSAVNVGARIAPMFDRPPDISPSVSRLSFVPPGSLRSTANPPLIREPARVTGST